MIPSGIRRTYDAMSNKELTAEMKRHSNINSDAFQYIQTALMGRLLLAVDDFMEVLNAGREGPEDGEVPAGEQLRKRKPSKGTRPKESDSQPQE